MAFRLGFQAVAKYQTDGVAGSAGKNAATNIRDLTLSIEKNTAEVTTRAAEGWRQFLAALKDAEVTFNIVWDTEDPFFEAISDSFFNDTVIGMAFLDQDTGAGIGLVADFMVTNFTRNETLEEALTVDVTLKPAYSATAPEWTESGWS